MDKDTALAIAANDSSVTTAQLKEAITRYADLISICSTCDGSGGVTVKRVTDLKWQGGAPVKVGDSVPCFSCGGTGKDQRYTCWVCNNENGSECTAGDPHSGPGAHCGWFFTVP